ncbi:MAG: 3-oxoacid CoA-transferase subunit B [Sporomusaceae bacterium]|nr:3-oxoacid CoA-transferase subunit B [Sporomusaceae bacterium]
MTLIDKELAGARIAKNIAALFNAAEEITILNLGVGIPTQVANYITNDNVFIQAENGMLGVGPIADGDEIHPQLINAGRQPVKQTPGCVFFDSSASFGMIRGGHIDATVLGAFEVDQQGNVANWIIPNGKMLGVGGAMDLVAGAKRVIIAMQHTSKGQPKLLKACTLPVTGFGEVDVVVTELAMFFFEQESIILKAIAPEVDVDYIKNVTGFAFAVSNELRIMEA